MSDFDKYTRVDKFEKRRKTTKSISILLVLSSILILILIGIWIFGGDDDKLAEDASTPEQGENVGEETPPDNPETKKPSEGEQATDENTGADESTPENSTNEETEHTLTDDENVIDVYTDDWQPIGTEQQGTHTTNYDEDSQDRLEMEKAIRMATGLEQKDMTTWWLENGGDQKVIATVSNGANTEVYRTYIQWVGNEGWQPTKVEKLEENDQDWRFE